MLEAVEEAQQPIAGPEEPLGCVLWRCLGEGFLLHREGRLEIDLGGLDRLMSQPERDDGAINACLEQPECHGMASMSPAT